MAKPMSACDSAWGIFMPPLNGYEPWRPLRRVAYAPGNPTLSQAWRPGRVGFFRRWSDSRVRVWSEA